MFKPKWIVLVTLLLSTLQLNAAAKSVLPSYTSSEHMTAGDSVRLSFNKNDIPATHDMLPLANGMSLSYGELVSLADFYGTPGHPIAEGKTAMERNKLFLAGYRSFAGEEKSKLELIELLEVIHAEKSAIEIGMQHGEKPYDVLYRIGDDNARKFNCITGGGCGAEWWLIKGRFLKLATRNFDHFGEDALVAYQTGHHLAMETAIDAGKTQDVNRLKLAYTMNAYASHFIADQFAAGHIRTPRKALQDHVTPSVVGSVLAAYMHYEDGPHGLHVYNNRGDHWTLYGDAYYFSEENAQNRVLLSEALQTSANEVFSAYETGVEPDDQVMQLIPHAEQINNEIKNDIATLFYWDEAAGKLYRRSDTTNVNDYHWTTSWWGWSTLVKLKEERGLPTHAQHQLAASPYAKKALALGLLTDKDIAASVR